MIGAIDQFAGPLATIVASGVAAYFVRRQAKTAELQAHTALDQLRFSVFEKRFELYDAARTLLRMALNEGTSGKFSITDAIPYQVKLGETVFFFPDDLCGWLNQMSRDVDEYLIAVRTNDGSASVRIGTRLSEHLQGVRGRFEPEMAFRQLRYGTPKTDRTFLRRLASLRASASTAP